jgi:hypothetical protein
LSAALALIVAAILTLGVAAIAWGISRLRDRSEAESMGKAVDGIVAKAFAYRMERVCSSSTINEDGDVIARRELYGVQPNEGFAVHRLISFIGTSGTRVEGPLHELHGAHPTFRVDATGSTKSRAEIKIDLDQPLEYPDKVDFVISATFAKAFQMSRKEVSQAYRNDDFKHEYHASIIDIPITVLELKVTFPESFEVKFHSVVFYGDSEIIAEQETRAIAGALEASSQSASLRIENPKLALQYAIYWIPKR